jgi:uncharacterized membrane protein
VQHLLHRPQSQSLRDLGSEADVEVGFADPHPVQMPASLRATATIAHTMLTAQVSDVGITDKTIRRTATAHGIISFVFNTALVALMVNIAASAI